MVTFVASLHIIAAPLREISSTSLNFHALLDFLSRQFYRIFQTTEVLALATAQQINACIDSLAPDPYEVVRTIKVVIRPQGDQYLATFYDANLTASGDTDTEAVTNLKDIIVATIELLANHDDDTLGTVPARQKATLAKFVKPAPQNGDYR
jgi:hypothetical protein